MALTREDKCRHFMNGAYFDRCLTIYTGNHDGNSMTWEICVYASDLPPGTSTNPLHSDILVVADVQATALYNFWVEGLPNLGESSSTDGLGGVVIP